MMNDDHDDTAPAGDDTAALVPETLTLPLRRPIAFAKVEYTELTLTEPDVKQLTTSDRAGRPMAQAAMLIHLNAQVPMGVVERMSQRDFQAAMDFFNRFGESPAPASDR